MNRFVCIHGHFYQPPRENPWLEYIEHQPTAHPYHDWNEKIAEECYTPNSASRLVNKDNKIVDISNNYAHISFNFGPTLLSWLESTLPDTYAKILDADRISRTQFGGHGSALAQAYNHMILPLSNTRDKITQVRWGIRDFELRFGRSPEGMWLPETAVNIESLQVLADHGILFTILAPRQADSIRKIGDDAWKSVRDSTIDPKRPYRLMLPNGKSIVLFFYDGPVSQSVGFEKLLSNGKEFADRLVSLFAENKSPQLVHIATDGETYGHHHKYGDMSLAYCVQYIREHKLARITNYGEFLELNPPEYEVTIIENSSWSCVHGVERWKADCGCQTLQHPDWNQKWREPLRNAFDWLRDSAAAHYEREMGSFSDDPWELRNTYIDVILNRDAENIESFLKNHLRRELNDQERIKVLKLLEMQRHALLMYTSCGWFFDEVSGIETTQVLKYAARVVQLFSQTAGGDIEPEFVHRLQSIPTNIPKLENGRRIYELFVKPASVDMIRVCAHYAMSYLFEQYEEEAEIYCYLAKNLESNVQEMGKRRYILGKAELFSRITHEKVQTSYSVVYLGDHNLTCGIREYSGEETYAAMKTEMMDAFGKDEVPLIIKLLMRFFDDHTYSIHHLFRHEQERVYREIFAEAINALETHSRQIYESYYPLLRAEKNASFMFPKILSANIEFVINRDIINILRSDEPDPVALTHIAHEIEDWSFQIDKVVIGYNANIKLNDLMFRLKADPSNKDLARLIRELLGIFNTLELQLNLWRSQNTLTTLIKNIKARAPDESLRKIDPADTEWARLVNELAAALYIAITV